MNKPIKFVVVYEMDNGYMDCIAICDNANEAIGEAYIALCDGLDADKYYVTLIEDREGDNGCVIEVVDKETKKIIQWATVLRYIGGTEVGDESQT